MKNLFRTLLAIVVVTSFASFPAPKGADVSEASSKAMCSPIPECLIPAMR
jgi:hypothetical protein